MNSAAEPPLSTPSCTLPSVQICRVNSPLALTVSSTGEVFAGAEELGSLQLANFDDPTKLLPFGAGYYDGGTANPQAIDPKETTISQGYTEVANTTPMVEMSQLLGTLRHFEANQRIMKMQDENMGKMIRELAGND